jgi:hypothetical protein
MNSMRAAFVPVINERIAHHTATAKRARAKVRELATKGKLNTPGVLKNHAIAAEAETSAKLWQSVSA